MQEILTRFGNIIKLSMNGTAYSLLKYPLVKDGERWTVLIVLIHTVYDHGEDNIQGLTFTGIRACCGGTRYLPY